MSSGPPDVSTPIHAARPWPKAAGLAAAAIYIPQLLPLVATDLLDHGHCLGIYARMFPMLVGFRPGIAARIASNVGEPWEEVVFFAVAIMVTLALLGGTALALRRWPRAGLVVAFATAVSSVILAMGAVVLIRS